MIRSLRLLSIIAALLSLLFFSCTKEDEAQPEEEYAGPAIVFKNINTLYSEEAKLKLKLEAPTQVVYHNGNVRYPEGIRISSYDENGIKTTVLTADSASYSKANSLYTAYGHVHIVNLVEQQHLQTEELHWNQRTKEIYTEKAIKITTPKELLTGRGLTSDESFTHYKVKEAKGTFNLSDVPSALPIDSLALEAESVDWIRIRQTRRNHRLNNPQTRESETEVIRTQKSKVLRERMLQKAGKSGTSVSKVR